MKNKTKLSLWYVFNIVVAILPLIVLLCIQWDEYVVYKEQNGVSVSIGFVMLAIAMALIMLNKASFLKGFVGCWVATIICYCLRFILNDLVLILLCVSIGATLSKFITSPKVLKYKRLCEVEENAEVQSTVMNAQVDKIVEALKVSGRG